MDNIGKFIKHGDNMVKVKYYDKLTGTDKQESIG